MSGKQFQNLQISFPQNWKSQFRIIRIDGYLSVSTQETLNFKLLQALLFGINYSEDMPADQKDRYIYYLVVKVNELDLDKRAMELAVEEFQGIHNNVLEQLAELQRSIAEKKRIV